jgi:hypothetical protein
MQKDTRREYAIYLLSDPRDDLVYYVGMTSSVLQRWHQHMRCDGHNTKKNDWIEDLKANNLSPHFTIIEVVVGVRKAKKRETHWIQYYFQKSPVLLNIVEVPAKRGYNVRYQ